MTDTRDELAEVIAQADPEGSVADVLIADAILASGVLANRADAWEAGFRAGLQATRAGEDPFPPNPYRKLASDDVSR